MKYYPNKRRAVSLVEALTYVGVLAVVIFVGGRTVGNGSRQTAVIRSQAKDLSAALHAGERWRSDVRAAITAPELVKGARTIHEETPSFLVEAVKVSPPGRRGGENLMPDAKNRQKALAGASNSSRKKTQFIRLIQIKTSKGLINYSFDGQRLMRSVGEGKPQELIRGQVENSRMILDERKGITAWRWELELKRRNPRSQTRTLFTFLAVPAAAP